MITCKAQTSQIFQKLKEFAASSGVRRFGGSDSPPP